MILVLGATGTVGRRLSAALERDGRRVRAASRSARPAGVRFDWGSPDTWRPALAGATALFLMAPDGVPIEPEFLDTAVDSGVRRVVLLSSGAVEEMGDERLLAAERDVRRDDLEWTILRPSWFDQNFDEGFFCPGVMSGEVLMPVGDLRQAFVDAVDIAAVAAGALTAPGHAGQTYEVRGPRALTFSEAVETIASVTGRRVRFVGEPEAYLSAHRGFGRSQDEVQGELDAFAALRRRGDDVPNDVVESVAGRPARTFEAYARAAAARGAWRDE